MTCTKHAAVAALATLAALLAAPAAHAAAPPACDATFVGTVTTSWDDAANWSPVGVPGSGDAVCIGAGATALAPDADTTVGSLVVAGDLTVGSGRVLDTGALYQQPGGTLRSEGTTVVAGAANVDGGEMTGAPVRAGSVAYAGGLSGGSSDIVVSGPGHTVAGDVPAGHTLRVTGDALSPGVLDAAAPWTNAGHLVLGDPGDADEAWALDGSALDNRGTIDAAAGGTIGALLSNLADGTVNVVPGAGSATSVAAAGPLDNRGALTIASGGSLTTDGAFTQSAGVTELAGGSLTAPGGTSLSGGVLRGSGQVHGDVTNAAEIRPGVPDATGFSPGTIAVDGGYTQTPAGTLSGFTRGGTPADGGQSALVVAGTATLDGAEALATAAGYAPGACDVVPTLVVGAYAGDFASHAAPTVAGGAWLAHASGSGSGLVRGFRFATAPGAPSDVQAAPRPGGVDVRWNPSVTDNCSPVTGFDVVATAPDGAVAASRSVAAGATLPLALDLPRDRVAYAITVTAHNALGASPASAPRTVTLDPPPAGGPAAPDPSPAAEPPAASGERPAAPAIVAAAPGPLVAGPIAFVSGAAQDIARALRRNGIGVLLRGVDVRLTAPARGVLRIAVVDARRSSRVLAVARGTVVRAGRATFRLRAAGRARRALRRARTRKVAIRVTFTPSSGPAAAARRTARLNHRR